MVLAASTQPMKEKHSTMSSSLNPSFRRTKSTLGSEFDKHDPWITTVSGRKFHFLRPRLEEIDIDDIAHALANTCRYTGHCRKFYSVAEHSVAVSELCDNPLVGLMHDASEAYITDISSPVKPILTNYRALEAIVMDAIFAKYNLPLPLTPDIKMADMIQLSTEARHLVVGRGDDWEYWGIHGGRPKEHGIIPRCLLPKEAKKMFLAKFEELTQ